MSKILVKSGNLGRMAGGERNKVPVFLASDVNYYQHACVLIISLLENNRDLDFEFYIMTDVDSPESAKILSLQDRYTNCRIKFTVMDNEQYKQYPVSRGITLQTYYRYEIPNLIPDSKALYLDVDMVCKGSIRGLWETDLEDNYAAGVFNGSLVRKESRYLQDTLGLLPEQLNYYVNAGMLLLNMRKWREDNITERLIKNTEELKSAVLQYFDQDVINYTFRDKIKLVDKKYNCLNGEYGFLYAAIIHYNGSRRPWKKPRLVRPLNWMYYFRYLKKSPYREKYKEYSFSAAIRQLFHRIEQQC